MNNNSNDLTSTFDKKDIEMGKGMSVLAYLGILCLIPLYSKKDNKYVQFHAKQGANLFACALIANLVLSFLANFLSFFNFLSAAISIVQFVLSVMGIVNVFKEKAVKLPIIDKIQIVK